MKLSRKWILVAALVLSVAMATSGTLAYLTDRDSATNVFTFGNVDIKLNETFGQGSQLIPGKDINKLPSIENTGKTSAWVWMTLSIPAELDVPTSASDNVIHWNWTGATDEALLSETSLQKAHANGWISEDITMDMIKANKWTWDMSGDAYETKIGGKVYHSYDLLYNAQLAPGEKTLPGIVKVYMDDHIDIDPEGNLHHVQNGNVTDIDWNINTDGTPTIYIAAYAIQTEGFANVDLAYAAYTEQWGNNGGVEYDTKKVAVATNEDFAAAVTSDEATIIVDLKGDVTYDVAAWNNFAMGGEKTENIIINGNGHTITFNQKDSDWDNIVTNGATLAISNAKITNSGYNDGPWNRHDLNFGCDVVLNNVTSDKALAFKAGAALKNVIISDANTSDTYAIWVQPNGQTVTLDGCTIDMLDCTDGRGLKIDNQYVAADDEGKVTLVVKNTTFKTEEKSAILVKSTKGADITLENVDITGVKADSTNEVWVDEASAAYADLVTVTGGTKIVEP